jgi:hypothetical protein
VVVAFAQLELELDAAEERGRRVKDEAVGAGLELVCEAGASVGVGRDSRDLLVAPEQADGDTRSRVPAAGVEDVRGE